LTAEYQLPPSSSRFDFDAVRISSDGKSAAFPLGINQRGPFQQKVNWWDFANEKPPVMLSS
jgi:hypothetical protein